MRRGKFLTPAIALACIASAWILVANGGAAAQSSRPRQFAQSQQDVGERELTIVNRSAHPVTEIFVSPSSAQQWGDGRLGRDPLPPAKSIHLRLGRVQDCGFDIQVIYDNTTREESHNVNLCRMRQVSFDGRSALPIEPGANGNGHALTLTNHAGRPIQQVFLSETDSDEWGDDRLGDDTLSVGEAKTVVFTEGCKADLRIVYDNRSAEERRGVDICATPRLSIEPGWTTADTLPTELVARAPASLAGLTRPIAARPGAAISVVNSSGRDVAALYLSPERGDRGQDGPGPDLPGTDLPRVDLLGADPLRDGSAVTVRLDTSGACEFTAHVVFSGHESDRDIAGLDLCANPRVEVTRPDSAPK